MVNQGYRRALIWSFRDKGGRSYGHSGVKEGVNMVIQG